MSEQVGLPGTEGQLIDQANADESTVPSSISGILMRVLYRLLSLVPWGARGQIPVQCVFCRIARGDDPTSEIHYHDSQFVVISDIAPASTHHYLVIPKEHIRDVRCLDDRHIDMVRQMADHGRKVGHLHMHIISPESAMSKRNELTFRNDSYWFRSADAILEMLTRLQPTPSRLQTPSSDKNSTSMLAKLS
ncbi:histidine triad nucleotide-binding protein 3-like isoform X2 [Varroa jacobsoni]|uniref:histidine triad nucleotide-binding protein 3-like isoform X2 n=1 Tax=Varroa jacobsoni TaxID=62625 RepID=UPI000BF2A899|nr:histidine triad nucleotide-binding protein 3-like isoform X2 [Varroa jacobsoni]